MRIHKLIEQWQFALKYEAAQLKKNGGAKYRLQKGTCVHRIKNTRYFTCITNGELPLPDGASVMIEINGESFQALIISNTRGEILLSITDVIMESFKEAWISSETWQLLLELSKRLEEAKEDKHKRSKIQHLMKPSKETNHPVEKIKNNIHELYLRTKYNPSTFIWGPPGTGKTYTLARLAARKLVKGKRVLILSHSNAALDVLMEEITRYLIAKKKWKDGKVLRYGMPGSDVLKKYPFLSSMKWTEECYPEINRDHFSIPADQTPSAIKTEFKEKEKGLVKDARMIGSTLSKAAADPAIYLESFDLVIIDEASMAYVPQLAFASTLGKRIAVCGDFMQLPPVAISKHPMTTKWLQEDIFHHAGVASSLDKKKEVHPQLFMLKEQRRMHPAISSFTNRHVYQNQVFDHPSTIESRASIVEKAPFPNAAAIFLNMDTASQYGGREGSSFSRFHLFSALAAVQLMMNAKSDGLQSIGFISPYRAQAKLVQTFIDHIFEGEEEGLSSATVHKFQGSEKDMILFDLVDTDSHSTAGRLLTNENSLRMVNVAVTRSRGKFIALGNDRFIKRKFNEQQPVRKMASHYSEEGRFEDIRGVSYQSTNKRLIWMDGQQWAGIVKDIQRAEKEIVISIQHPNMLGSKIWDELSNKGASIKIRIITPDSRMTPLTTYQEVETDYQIPFIIIDRKVIWSGGALTEKSILPFARLWSKDAVRTFIEMMDLHKCKVKIIKAASVRKGWKKRISLQEYLATWDTCPFCGGRRNTILEGSGRVLFSCLSCSEERYLTIKQLELYLNHAAMTCPEGHTDLYAEKNGRHLEIKCRVCKEKNNIPSIYY
ncbi:AAA domain-containing protein [Falsibacillus pallidus]|uniref:AAA domain-containing protein n=1 Tax=Falsibacillus pallidus TaxID=493781 RepID=A0A370GQ27_9BACI|nr:AAA domain-containing protein [Falsibacillus pallidus]RDI45825.1 AAA domain-containing protein [Falsibacillus pallidus]